MVNKYKNIGEENSANFSGDQLNFGKFCIVISNGFNQYNHQMQYNCQYQYQYQLHILTLQIAMGSCMNSDKQKNNRHNFIEDRVLIQKTQTYHPIESTLYGILRKPSDLQIIYSNPPSNKYLSAESIKSMDQKQIKMLFSFKKLLMIGKFQSLQQLIRKIQSSCTVIGVYVLEENKYIKFTQYFPIYKQLQKSYQTLQIPLLVFDSQELLNPSESRCTLFIHLQQNKNDEVYNLLNIKKQNIIQSPKQITQKSDCLSYYSTKLKTQKHGKVLLLHNKNIDQNDLLQLISTWLMYKYQLQELSTKKYLSRTLPKAFILSNKSELLIASNQNRTKHNSQVSPPTSIEIYQQLFKKHHQENGAQKTQRAYNLLIKLISNIYSNQNNQNYRKVKGLNKQMQQLLTRSKQGKKLLDEVGFKQKQGFWINSLEDKYLKVIRTDLDLAFKNYLN